MAKWYEEPRNWLALAALGGVALLERGTVDKLIVAPVKDVINRGRQVTHSTLDARGVVAEDPRKLRERGSVLLGIDLPLDVYSAARMLRSEGAAEGAVRVHVALNDLAHLGWDSLHQLLTYSTAGWAKGSYGRQHSVDPETGAAQTRRYATSHDPFENDIQVAFATIADHAAGNDPTGGAVKFFDKSGVLSGQRSWEDVDAKWAAEGLVGYTLPQYGDDLVLYRRA